MDHTSKQKLFQFVIEEDFDNVHSLLNSVSKFASDIKEDLVGTFLKKKSDFVNLSASV